MAKAVEFPAGEPGSSALDVVYRRYHARLVSLANRWLSPQLARREDAEDVVQSAFRSLFRGERDGQFEPRSGTELWGLLVAITYYKVKRKLEHHTAGIRSIHCEVELGGTSDGPAGFANTVPDVCPSPEELATLADELDLVLEGFENPLHRQIVEMTLQGIDAQQVAATVDRSKRLVNLVLERFREELEERLTTVARG